MAPKSTTGKTKTSGSKSGGMQKSQDRMERSVAPNSTTDPKRDKVNKEMNQRDKQELISSFQDQLELKQRENEREVRRTLGKISFLRKENDRMQRQQMAEYGVTLDILEELKASLEKTRSQNDKLHEDMLEAKALHDKLEIELKETKRRYTDTIQEVEGLQKMSKVWNNTTDELLRTEERCTMLQRNNRKLRIILLKNHIDPTADPREHSRDQHSDRKSVVSNKTYPDTSPRRKLTVKPQFQTFKDINTLRKANEEDRRRGSGVNPLIFDQVDPAYLGFYIKRRQAKRLENPATFRSGTNLPRIVFG
ncbi:hypothetical protein ACF0H5_001421 [Mactra antiquata]